MQAYADYLDVEFAELPLQAWSLQEHDITLAIVKDDGSCKRYGVTILVLCHWLAIYSERQRWNIELLINVGVIG